MNVVIIMQRQTDLLEIVDALRTTRRLSGRLHGWQQQRDQNGDDRDHHQEFNQRETATPPRETGRRDGFGQSGIRFRRDR